MTPVKKYVQRGIPCCSGKKESLLDVVCVRCVGMCSVWVWCCAVLCGVVCAVLCLVVCCVVCLVVCVSHTHSRSRCTYTYRCTCRRHSFCSLTFHIGFMFFLLLAAVSSSFRDFKPY